MLQKQSLSELSYQISDFFTFNKPISYDLKTQFADSILNRVGMEYSYSGLPAPFPSEVTQGIQLYTGESLKSRASIRHIGGEEALRALKLLDLSEKSIKDLIKRIELSMLISLENAEKINKKLGMFCCGKCTVAMWRVLTVGGYNRQEERLTSGLKWLKSLRNSKQEWNRFPYYYTLSALNEMPFDLVEAEVKYIAKTFEKRLKYQKTVIGKRREKIITDLANKLSGTV